jgi:hypothetical protein
MDVVEYSIFENKARFVSSGSGVRTREVAGVTDARRNRWRRIVDLGVFPIAQPHPAGQRPPEGPDDAPGVDGFRACELSSGKINAGKYPLPYGKRADIVGIYVVPTMSPAH